MFTIYCLEQQQQLVCSWNWLHASYATCWTFILQTACGLNKWSLVSFCTLNIIGSGRVRRIRIFLMSLCELGGLLILRGKLLLWQHWCHPHTLHSSPNVVYGQAGSWSYKFGQSLRISSNTLERATQMNGCFSRSILATQMISIMGAAVKISLQSWGMQAAAMSLRFKEWTWQWLTHWLRRGANNASISEAHRMQSRFLKKSRHNVIEIWRFVGDPLASRLFDRQLSNLSCRVVVATNNEVCMLSQKCYTGKVFGSIFGR